MNPYAILEIAPGATPEEIKTAYHRLAKQWHPDRFSGAEKEEAEQRFRQLAEAFAMLKDRRGREPAVVAEAAPVQLTPPRPAAAEPAQNKTAEDWFADAKKAFATRDFDRALGLAHYVLRLDPGKAEHHAFLASVLEATGGDKRIMIRALEGALAIDPQDVGSMLKMASAFDDLGMMARAQGTRERARKLAPDHPAFRVSEPKASSKEDVRDQPSLGEQFASLVDQVKNALGRFGRRG